jgi:hypothetical protein
VIVVNRTRCAATRLRLLNEKRIHNGPKNKVGLDFEENLEGFIQFLNWLSIVSYTPAITAIVGLMGGAMVRGGRLKAPGRTLAVLVALNWVSLRWLERRFLSPPKNSARRAA